MIKEKNGVENYFQLPELKRVLSDEKALKNDLHQKRDVCVKELSEFKKIIQEIVIETFYERKMKMLR